MGRIEQSIEVNAPVNICFDQWSRFHEFPRFMKNVENIRHKGDINIWEWTIRGPLGQSISFDAEMDARQPDQVISWHTIRDSQVEHAGAVTFEEIGQQATRINVRMEYHAPAGALGDLVANIFKNPDGMVKEDLQNFKELVERGNTVGLTGGRGETSYSYYDRPGGGEPL